MWKDQFEWLYRENETFVFVMSIHPQVSGKPQVVAMHERLISWLNGFEGVEWCTCSQMVSEFKSGKIAGARIEDGASS
jgi:hypothetical protein